MSCKVCGHLIGYHDFGDCGVRDCMCQQYILFVPYTEEDLIDMHERLNQYPDENNLQECEHQHPRIYCMVCKQKENRNDPTDLNSSGKPINDLDPVQQPKLANPDPLLVNGPPLPLCGMHPLPNYECMTCIRKALQTAQAKIVKLEQELSQTQSSLADYQYWDRRRKSQ